MVGVSISQDREVGREAQQVASADPGDLVGQWKDLDAGFVLLFRDIGFYLI